MLCSRLGKVGTYRYDTIQITLPTRVASSILSYGDSEGWKPEAGLESCTELFIFDGN